MSTRRERRKKKILLIFLSCIVFGIGYYFLNEVSTWFEVPLGITFHVIFGCTLMAVSGIYIGYSSTSTGNILANGVKFTGLSSGDAQIYFRANSMICL